MASSSSSVAAPETSPEEPAKPLFTIEIGARLRCEWREGELRDAEVIERRIMDSVPQYYIHYADFNRRLDEWVKEERLHKPEPSASRVGNERKRKLDPAVASGVSITPLSHAADEAAAGELDAATQKEHEAATRVKNINSIQLGKWVIQTWCELAGRFPHACAHIAAAASLTHPPPAASRLSNLLGTTRRSQRNTRTARRCIFASTICTSRRSPRPCSAT